MTDSPGQSSAITIDILTTTIRPEMIAHCKWMFDRQDVDAELNHTIHVALNRIGTRDHRLACLKTLMEKSTADYFMIADDDDYVGPGFVRRCLDRIGTADVYGEIPTRVYLMTGAYGEGTDRTTLFRTFTLYRKGFNAITPSDHHGPFADDLIIIRGMMADPGTSITERKNTYDEKHWPNLDPEYDKLQEWLAKDPTAFDRYMELRQ